MNIGPFYCLALVNTFGSLLKKVLINEKSVNTLELVL